MPGTHYAFRNTAGAVTAAPKSAFTSGAAINQVGTVVPKSALGRGQAGRHGECGSDQAIRAGRTHALQPTAVPPASATNRNVVTHATPPAGPARFERNSIRAWRERTVLPRRRAIQQCAGAWRGRETPRTTCLVHRRLAERPTIGHANITSTGDAQCTSSSRQQRYFARGNATAVRNNHGPEPQFAVRGSTRETRRCRPSATTLSAPSGRHSSRSVTGIIRRNMQLRKAATRVAAHRTALGTSRPHRRPPAGYSVSRGAGVLGRLRRMVRSRSNAYSSEQIAGSSGYGAGRSYGARARRTSAAATAPGLTPPRILMVGGGYRQWRRWRPCLGWRRWPRRRRTSLTSLSKRHRRGGGQQWSPFLPAKSVRYCRCAINLCHHERSGTSLLTSDP